MTHVNFVDVSGQPRPEDEIEQALMWASRKLLKPDISDPEGVIMLVTIRGALQELLALRRIIAKARADSQEGRKA